MIDRVCRALAAGVLAVTTSAAAPLSSHAMQAPQQSSDTVVRQAGRPAFANGATLLAELTVGVVDGAQEYMFGNVRDVLELRDGSILVVDGGTAAVREYDAKGTYVRTIGRKGQGPGEYLRPGMLGELRDGRIVLVDGGNVRVNVYRRDGAPDRSWSLARSSGNVAASRVTIDTTGTAILSVSAFGGGATEGLRILRFAPDGRLIDTVHAPTFSYTPPTADVRTARMTAQQTIPFLPTPRWVWSPLGYMVTGLPTRYAFELRIPRPGKPPAVTPIPAMRYRGPTAQWAPRDPVVSIRHSVPTVQVSDEQRSVERDVIESNLKMADPTYRYSGPDIPRTKPPYKELRVGEDGSIWVQLSMPGERYMPDPPATPPPMPQPLFPRWREPRVHDVFEPDGRYLGRVTIPNNVTILRMTRDKVWGSFTDEDDVAVVKRFRIAWR